MWRGYEQRLSLYGGEICNEWIQCGYVDTLQQRFINLMQNLLPTGYPPSFTSGKSSSEVFRILHSTIREVGTRTLCLARVMVAFGL